MLSLIETKIADLVDSDISLFVFGSSLVQSTPSDIDLLIVYKNGCIKKCREVKQTVIERLSDLHLPIDWVSLSETEEREVAFVQKERAVKLGIPQGGKALLKQPKINSKSLQSMPLSSRL